MTKSTTRPIMPEDEHDVVQIYNTITGAGRTVAQHRWEWLSAPEGKGSAWVIELENDNDSMIIGHHGLLPIRFNANGKLPLGGKTENTVVMKDYKGKILYPRMERSFINQARKRFDFLYTTAALPPVAKLRKGMGYHVIGMHQHYIRIFHTAGFRSRVYASLRVRLGNSLLAKILITTASWAAPLLCIFFMTRKSLLNLTLERVLDIHAVTDDIDQLWADSAASHGTTPARSAAFIKWRIFDNPHANYVFYLAREQGQVAGYVVIELKNNTAALVDILARDRCPNRFKAMLTRLEKILAKTDIHTITAGTLVGEIFLPKVLCHCGFRSLPFNPLAPRPKTPKTVLLAMPLSPDLDEMLTAKHWYYTDILLEGLAHIQAESKAQP